MSEEEKKWLIRSSNYILGPFSKKEIIKQVKNLIISHYDEVTQPNTVWLTLEHHEEFKEIVKEVSANTRLTNLITNISGKVTKVTKSIKTQETTENVTATLKKEDFKLIENPNSSGQTSSQSQYIATREKEAEMKKKAHHIARYIWKTVIAIGVFVFGYIIFREFINPKTKEKLSAINIKKATLSAYKTGDFNTTYKYLKESLNKNLLNKEEKLRLVPVLIYNQDLQSAQNILSSTSKNTTDILLSKGILNLYNRNFRQAENFFNQTKNTKPTLSLFNLSILKYLEKKYSQSLILLREISATTKEPIRGLTLLISLLNATKIENNIAQLQSIVKNSIKNTQEYHQEFYLIQAYLYVLDKQWAEAQQALEKMLNQDPYFYKEYFYDLLIASKAINWQVLFPYCEVIFNSNQESPLYQSLYGLCLIKTKNKAQAEIYLKRAKNQEPNKEYILSTYIYLLIENGRFLEAEVALENLNEILNRNLDKHIDIFYILQGHLYEKKQEWSLALSTWKSLLNINASHLTAIRGMAVSNHKLKDKEVEKLYVDRGLSKYPYLHSLLILKNSN